MEPEKFESLSATSTLSIHGVASALRVDAGTCSWKGVIVQALAWGLSPIVTPLALIASKILKRPIMIFPYKY